MAGSIRMVITVMSAAILFETKNCFAGPMDKNPSFTASSSIIPSTGLNSNPFGGILKSLGFSGNIAETAMDFASKASAANSEIAKKNLEEAEKQLKSSMGYITQSASKAGALAQETMKVAQQQSNAGMEMANEYTKSAQSIAESSVKAAEKQAENAEAFRLKAARDAQNIAESTINATANSNNNVKLSDEAKNKEPNNAQADIVLQSSLKSSANDEQKPEVKQDIIVKSGVTTSAPVKQIIASTAAPKTTSVTTTTLKE